MENIVYNLTDDQQTAIYNLFSAACKDRDITTGFAAVRADILRNIIERLGKNAYSHGIYSDLHALSVFLDVEAEAEEILSQAELLDGPSLDIVHQLRSQ